MKSYVEKEWVTEEGYRAAVTINLNFGYRCGYVEVPKDIKLPDDFNMTCDVHGGITFDEVNQEYPVQTNKPVRWIGFDAAHFYDKPDIEALNNLQEVEDNKEEINPLYPSFNMLFDNEMEFINEKGVVRSTEFMVDECNKLSKQIKENAKSA